MTPRKAAAKRADDWARALKDNRVVKYDDLRMVSYPTREMRDDATTEATKAGIPWAIIVVDHRN